MSAETIQFNSHTIELSNKDKVFFPDAEITKGDLKEALTVLHSVQGWRSDQVEFFD